MTGSGKEVASNRLFYQVNTRGQAIRRVAIIQAFVTRADVAKLADAPDLGSGFRKEVEVQFVADNPGLSLFHCHMQLHMDFGFMTLVEYEDKP